MADPRTTLLGGDTGLVSQDQTKGVHAQSPATQLKYSTAWNNARQTMARMIVPLSPAESDAFLASFQDNTQVQNYLKAIVGSNGYIDFLLESVSESFEEKSQVVELMNDDYVSYFYGKHPSVFQFSGTLFTTQQDDWWTAFTYVYDKVARGSALASLGHLVSLRYDSRLVTGSILNFQTTLTSETQMIVKFNFSLLVKTVEIVPALQKQLGVLPPTQASTAFTFAGGLSAQAYAAQVKATATLGRKALISTLSNPARVAPSANPTTPQAQATPTTTPSFSDPTSLTAPDASITPLALTLPASTNASDVYVAGASPPSF